MVLDAPRGAMNDDELARAFAARAPGALEEAYLRHAGVLTAVARKVLGCDGDAEDCVHDALMRVWLSEASYRSERGALRAFLIVCVRNEALSRRRAAARHLEIEERVAREQIDEGEEAFSNVDPIERRRLAAALRALPDDQRTVIALAYFDGKTQTEIAAALKIPLGTVKSRASHALRKLSLALVPGAS